MEAVKEMSKRGLIDIDEETYKLLKEDLENGNYKQYGRFNVNPQGELYLENDRDTTLNVRNMYTTFTLDQLRVLKIEDSPLIHLTLVLGDKHYNYNLYDNNDILIPGDVVIFDIYGVSFQGSFGTYTGEHLTERAIASFLIECWNKPLKPE